PRPPHGRVDRARRRGAGLPKRAGPRSARRGGERPRGLRDARRPAGRPADVRPPAPRRAGSRRVGRRRRGGPVTGTGITPPTVWAAAIDEHAPPPMGIPSG